MSTPRFTLGPWSFKDGSREVISPNVVVLEDDNACGDPECCGCPSYWIAIKPDDAALIAAAPTLFGIVRQYMASDERQGFTGTILYEQAKAAIDAATGEKS